MGNRTVNMTTGSPARHILNFAVPLILTNVGQQFYMIADAAIVGRGVGVRAFAAVGATDWCYWLILWTVGGLTQGFSTFVLRAFGEKNYREMSRFVARLFGCFPGMQVDPDKAVALGAALQCGMKARDQEIREVVLTDVCPYTLGTEIVMHNGIFEEDGHYLPIIERNTVIPVSRTQTVYTAHDNQDRVNIKVLQGESRLAYHNLQLGEISVPVPAGPKGKEAIDVTYTYDVNALLEVEILVHSTGVRRSIIIQNEQNRISDEEAAARLEKLQYLKLKPRDEEVNRLQILRGERLYEEIPEKRFEIDRALMEFEQVLSKQNRTEIEQARKRFSRLLDEIEFN